MRVITDLTVVVFSRIYCVRCCMYGWD